MNNPIKFRYNGKNYNPKNPEKKLKQLGITWDDVEIIEEAKKDIEIDEQRDIQLYYFINKKTGYSITSIYPECNENGYEKCTKETIRKKLLDRQTKAL